MLKNLKPFFLLCLIIPLFMGCESRKTVVTGLDEREANEIWVFLSSKGIDVTKVQSADAGGGGARKEITWDIQVRSDQAAEAIAILNQSGLPRKRGQSLLGIFKEGGGLVPSEMQEKIKKQAGTAEQISHTIRKIDGILDAEVLISAPEDDPLSISKEKTKVTASVFIKHSGVLDDPNSHLETKIKRLVASGVDGLDYDNVTVVGARARFSDYPLGSPGLFVEEDKPFVSIWSVIIAKESVGTFRFLFFTFIILILLLALLLVWTLWKTIPLLKDYGGMGSLFHLRNVKELPKEEGEEEEEPVEEEKPEEGEEEVAEEGEEKPEEDEEGKGPPSEVT